MGVNISLVSALIATRPCWTLWVCVRNQEWWEKHCAQYFFNLQTKLGSSVDKV